MSKLEPTRTYSNPTANDILRRMLDERDEYYKTSGNRTWWGRPIDRQTGKPINVFHYQAQPMGEDRLFVELQLATPEQAIAATLGPKVTGNTSDGYHTFNELYHHRAVLFSVIVRDHRELAWKSMRHHDGTMYDGMFIVGIETPEGQATYHYDIDPYWDMFNCKELDQAPEWDGHTPSEAIERIATLGSCNCSNNCTNGERTETCADGGTVSETYIRPTEEGPICPIPRASVIFEGQKLTFDEEDSARFAEIVKRHLRKQAGLEVEQ